MAVLVRNDHSGHHVTLFSSWYEAVCLPNTAEIHDHSFWQMRLSKQPLGNNMPYNKNIISKIKEWFYSFMAYVT